MPAAGTAAMGLSDVMLELSGFDVAFQNQPPEVLTYMKWMFIVTPIIIWSSSLLMIDFYPLTRQKLEDIRQLLETRRGKL